MSIRLARPVYMAAASRLKALSRQMATESSAAEPEITHEVQDGLRYLTLNRPSALNALNVGMIRSMKKLIDSWESSEEAQAVILQGKGRAFCAGGDVVSVVKLAQEDATRQEAIDFFKEEYDLDRQLAHLSKPAIATLDGITMGGGVGLSVHLPFRIVTENTVFSMPETTIGLFPDVGATFFLARMDGYLGAYLGLTSERLTGYAAYHAGVGTHFIPSGNLDFVKQRLLDWSRRQRTGTAAEQAETAYQEIDNILEENAADASFLREHEAKQSPISGAKRKAIDECFRHRQAEDIVTGLQEVADGKKFQGEGLEQWAKQTVETILKRSPTSVKVSLRAINLARGWGIDRVFESDMQLAATFCTPSVTTDFVTGVTHLLINKQRDTRADWKPETLAGIPNIERDSESIKTRFLGDKPLPSVKVPPLAFKAAAQSAATENGILAGGNGKSKAAGPADKDRNFVAYPHAYGLPSEHAIREVVTGEDKDSGSFAPTESEVVKKLRKQYKRSTGKVGLEEKVHEVVTRMCTQTNGQLSWNEPPKRVD